MTGSYSLSFRVVQPGKAILILTDDFHASARSDPHITTRQRSIRSKYDTTVLDPIEI